MGIVIQDDFYSESLVKYTVKIHDSDYVGSANPIDLRSCVITHKRAKERFEPISPSTCDIVAFVPNSTIENIILDLVSSPEDEFKLEILQNDSLIFAGYLLSDQISFADMPYPYEIRLRGVDGITRLKKKEYSNAGTPYTGKATIFEHIFNCLDQIGLDEFWGASDYYLETICNWWEDSQTFDTTKDPLQYARVDHRIFISVDDDGNVTPKNCYQVLDEICRAWGLNFKLSQGVYRLVQINEYNSATNVAKRTYTKSQTGPTVTLDFGLGDWVANKDTEVKVITGGNFNYLPGLDYTRVEYNHFSTANLLQGQTFNEGVGGAVTVPDIDDNGGNSKLSFSGNLEYSVDFDIDLQGQPSYFLFRIQVKIDTYYLHRPAYFTNGAITYGNAYWNATVGYYDVYSGVVEEGIPGNQAISFITPALPTDGDLEFNFFYQNAVNALGQTVSVVFTPAAELFNNYLEVYIDGTPNGQYDITRYQVNNDAEFTETIELTTLMGDGPTGNAFGHIESTSDLANWVYSNAWRVGNSGTYYAFSKLLCLEIQKGQNQATEVWRGRFDGVYYPHYIYVRDSKRYIYMGGKWNLGKDEFSGDWFVIGEHLTLTPEPDVNILVAIVDGKPYGNIPPSQSPGPPQISSTPGMGPVATSLVPTQVNTGITDGDTVISIDIPATTEDRIFRDGQTIVVTNPVTGEQQDFTVDGDVDQGATSITVDSEVATADFPVGSYIQTDAQETAAAVASAFAGPKTEWFTGQTGTEITLTNAIPATTGDIHAKLHVFRTGLKLRYLVGFTVDTAGGNNKILFTSNPLMDEDIEVLNYS